jgi:phage replication-related protein YjqB (UPF0714/DUF867 family)
MITRLLQARHNGEGMGPFAELLKLPGVEEIVELRGSFGFMAFHGGALEEMTDVIARVAAERCGASYYGVHMPHEHQVHLPSTRFVPSESVALDTFVNHVDTVITVHGYGREHYWTKLLLGGQNRRLAGHLAAHFADSLPHYESIVDLELIPLELRGLHADNPVNLVRHAGVQLELPPRIRGSSPIWADWQGSGMVPHTVALIESLVRAVTSWLASRPDGLPS